MTSSLPQDTVLTGGLILADPRTCEVVPHRTTRVSGDRLAQVNVTSEPGRQSENVIDCSGCLIMPGLVNAHNHAAMSLLRGIADDLPLDRWLNEFIFPAEGKFVSPNFVYLGTLLSCVEMALSGTTTFADGYFFMEQAAEATTRVGLRAVIAQGILDVPVPDAPEPGSWAARVETFLSNCRRDDLITPALFCHSGYLCGPETLRKAREVSRDRGLLMFSHVAETEEEVREVRKLHGKSPVQLFHDEGILGPDFVAVHLTHASDGEARLLSESGSGAVHCPESNMKLAAGAAPVESLLRNGLRVAVGTDGPASNNNLDMWEELRSASLLAKVTTGDPECLSAQKLLQMATVDAAEVLGMGDKIGTLHTGKCADLIVVDLDRPHLMPLYDPVSHLVYSAKGSDVRDVIVNGALIVRNGKMVTVEEHSFKSGVRELAREIAAEVGGARVPEPMVEHD